MKIIYEWSTFSIIQMLAALIPIKAKKYVMKWAARSSNDNIVSVRCIDDADKSICICIFQPFPCNGNLPSPIYATGISFKDAWENALSMIAEAENMKNAEELCIWLDMKDIA